jgi:hypothetical protein
MPNQRRIFGSALFSLTCFYELSNPAFLTTSALLLDIPIPHSLFLRETQQNYETTDIWANTLLNKSAHASDSRTTTHALLHKNVPKLQTVVASLPHVLNPVYFIVTQEMTNQHENE